MQKCYFLCWIIFKFFPTSEIEDDEKGERDFGHDGARKTNSLGQRISNDGIGTQASAIDADVRAATFLDVAVLRCLFVSQWQEEGIYWALQYLYNR